MSAFLIWYHLEPLLYNWVILSAHGQQQIFLKVKAIRPWSPPLLLPERKRRWKGKPSLLLLRSARLPWPVPVIGSVTCSHFSQFALVSGVSASLKAEALKRAGAAAFPLISRTKKEGISPCSGQRISWNTMSGAWAAYRGAGLCVLPLSGRSKARLEKSSLGGEEFIHSVNSYARHFARSSWCLSAWSWAEFSRCRRQRSGRGREQEL